MSADYPIFDFVSASQVERPLSQALKIWMSNCQKLFKDRWCEFSANEIQISPLLINAWTFATVRSKWTQPSVGLPITIKSAQQPAEIQGLLVIRRTDLIILMMEILSETLAEKPQDRELTHIELSLSELVLKNAVTALSEGWPAKETLPVSTAALDFEPTYSRMFSPKKEIISTGFEVRTSGGSEAGPAVLEWIFPKDELVSLLGVGSVPTSGQNTMKIDPQSVTQMNVNISASLGTAELAMGDLMRLAPGAIVRLNQRVDEPLTVSLNEQPKVLAWPGKKRNRPCVMVETWLNQTTQP